MCKSAYIPRLYEVERASISWDDGSRPPIQTRPVNPVPVEGFVAS